MAWANFTRCCMPVEKSPEESEALFLQTDQEQGLRGPAPGLTRRDAGELGGVGDEVGGGLVLGKAVALRHVSDPGADLEWLALRIVSEHLHRACGGMEQAEHQAEQGRLARPIGAHQAGHPVGHLQGEVANGNHLAVVVGEAGDFEDRGGHVGGVVAGIR